MSEGKQEEKLVSQESASNGSPDICKEPTHAILVAPAAPDGGWGWVVVASSFLIHIIVDGITYAFGILFVALLEDFHSGKGETAWILSIFVGLTLGAGPLASALVNKYNCRTVTIAGSFLGAAGFLISPFAPDMWFLYISLGVVSGIGFGLIYLPAIVIVGYYFERRRALATGLAVAGSGFGTFLFAPLIDHLIEEYGWKQSCFILAGIVLNCAVCGALFRPLPIEINRAAALAKQREVSAVKSVNKLKTSSGSCEKPPLEKTAPATGCTISPSVGTDTKAVIATDEGCSQKTAHANGNGLTDLDCVHLKLEGDDNLLHRPLYKKDVFYTGSLRNIPLYVSNRNLYIASNMSISNQDNEPQGSSSKCHCCPTDVTATFKAMIDMSLLQDAMFVLFLVSNFFTNFSFNAPFLFVPDRALSDGISSDNAAFLLSVIGIANTVGRVAFGCVSDLQSLKPYRLHVYSTGLVVAGVATALSPLGTQYWAMVVYCSIFGVAIGCYVSLTSVILVDLLGLDKLTSSFGMTLLVQGVAVVIGPPACGELNDITGSYTWPFVVLGLSIGISGVMLYFIPCLPKHQQPPAVAQYDEEMGKAVGLLGHRPAASGDHFEALQDSSGTALCENIYN